MGWSVAAAILSSEFIYNSLRVKKLRLQRHSTHTIKMFREFEWSNSDIFEQKILHEIMGVLWVTKICSPCLTPFHTGHFFQAILIEEILFWSLRPRTRSDQNFGQSQASINWSLRARGRSDQNYELFWTSFAKQRKPWNWLIIARVRTGRTMGQT